MQKFVTLVSFSNIYYFCRMYSCPYRCSRRDKNLALISLTNWVECKSSSKFVACSMSWIKSFLNTSLTRTQIFVINFKRNPFITEIFNSEGDISDTFWQRIISKFPSFGLLRFHLGKISEGIIKVMFSKMSKNAQKRQI